jgi:hypothetical protein
MYEEVVFFGGFALAALVGSFVGTIGAILILAL